MYYYEKILRELYKGKVKYLLVGGMAVNFHGYNRVTGDMDIILLLTDSNIKKFIKIVKQLGLKPRIPVKMEDFANERERKVWIKEKNMKAFALYNPDNAGEHIDIVIEHNINFKKAYEFRKDLEAGDFTIPLIGVDDLIKMKKLAGRPTDKIDIKALRKIQELAGE